MKKRFCDVCGTEINDKTPDAAQTSMSVHGKNVVISIKIGTNDTVDICGYCIASHLRSRDHRPEQRVM